MSGKDETKTMTASSPRADMTETERLYRARLRAVVQARIDADRDEDAPRVTLESLGRQCFPLDDGAAHDRASSATAKRKLAREMGTDPSDRTSDGVKWATLEALCSGLGCKASDLLG